MNADVRQIEQEAKARDLRTSTILGSYRGFVHHDGTWGYVRDVCGFLFLSRRATSMLHCSHYFHQSMEATGRVDGIGWRCERCGHVVRAVSRVFVNRCRLPAVIVIIWRHDKMDEL